MAFRRRDVMADQELADFLESQDIFATPLPSIDGELIVGFRVESIDASSAPDARAQPGVGGPDSPDVDKG